jgi:N-acetylglucosaminyldiphosphoundecaprenol N-acetyl-beta-D-mannosaminyltransferase
VDRVRLQGIGVDPLDVDGLLDRVGALVHAGRRSTVAYVNVHVLNEAARDPQLAAFLAGVDLCYADGAGVVLGARVVGKRLPPRMTGADWIWDLGGRAARDGWKLAWIGGEYGVAARAARVLESRNPGLEFVFTSHGYVRGEAAADRMLAKLSAAKPDILLVGMGTPHQERWVAAHRDRLDVPVVWCLGATADFVSGRTSRGPRWLHQRQEWLARLLVEPRRLWRRYLIGNPAFLLRMLRERRRPEP